MLSLYENMTWVADENGDRYVCVFDDEKSHSHSYNELSEDEKNHCAPAEFPWN